MNEENHISGEKSFSIENAKKTSFPVRYVSDSISSLDKIEPNEPVNINNIVLIPDITVETEAADFQTFPEISAVSEETVLIEVHHSQNSQDVKYALPSPVGSVDFNDALTTEEDEQNLNSDTNNNEPLWTIIGDEGKKRKVLQSSSDDETKKSAINYYLGSFVDSLPPILKGNVEKKAKTDPS